MNNPLYKKVSAIALAGTRNSEIRNKAFDGIRNKESVKAIMTHLGYVPNCYSKPEIWRLKPKPKAKPKLVVQEAPKSVREQMILNLQIKKMVTLKEINVTDAYARTVAKSLMYEGWNIEPVSKKNVYGIGRNRLIGYRLVK